MKSPHLHIKHLIFEFSKYNAVYFRVPKVASSSLLMTFRKVDSVEKVDNYKKSNFTFAFVRNPFDRLASCYRHVIQHGSFEQIQGDERLHKEMSFSDFVDAVSQTEIKNMDIHFRPQYTFIPHKPDFLGRFENLNTDYKLICDQLGIKDPGLLNENKTRKTIYSDYYTKQIIEKVVNIYKTDFELFDYDKALII